MITQLQMLEAVKTLNQACKQHELGEVHIHMIIPEITRKKVEIYLADNPVLRKVEKMHGVESRRLFSTNERLFVWDVSDLVEIKWQRLDYSGAQHE